MNMLSETFTNLSILGEEIKKKQENVKALHQDWLKLRDKLNVAVDDPLEECWQLLYPFSLEELFCPEFVLGWRFRAFGLFRLTALLENKLFMDTPKYSDYPQFRFIFFCDLFWFILPVYFGAQNLFKAF